MGPFDYDLFFSVFLILAVVVGGAGSLFGALLGSALITLLPVALSRSSGLTDAVFGVILIVLMIVAPGGVRGIADMWKARRRDRIDTMAGPPPAAAELPESEPAGVSDAVG